MPELSTITDPYLPEPKGISTAGSGKLYVADGLGSGDWLTPYLLGYEDVNDTGASQALAAATWTQITNDAAGANTNSSYVLPTASSSWNSTTNQFNFANSGLDIGDTLDMRLVFDITTATTNVEVEGQIKFGIGSGSEYTVPIFNRVFKTAGTVPVGVPFSMYIGNSFTRDYPAQIEINTDTGTTTVAVQGWFIRYLPRNPVWG